MSSRPQSACPLGRCYYPERNSGPCSSSAPAPFNALRKAAQDLQPYVAITSVENTYEARWIPAARLPFLRLERREERYCHEVGDGRGCHRSTMRSNQFLMDEGLRLSCSPSPGQPPRAQVARGDFFFENSSRAPKTDVVMAAARRPGGRSAALGSSDLRRGRVVTPTACASHDIGV
jgi:hypothetical protein